MRPVTGGMGGPAGAGFSQDFDLNDLFDQFFGGGAPGGFSSGGFRQRRSTGPIEGHSARRIETAGWLRHGWLSPRGDDDNSSLPKGTPTHPRLRKGWGAGGIRRGP